MSSESEGGDEPTSRPFAVVTQNVSSVVRYQDMIAEWSDHLVCLQETRLSVHNDPGWKRLMGKASWSVVRGPSPPVAFRVNSLAEPTASILGGVAIAAR